MPFPILFSTTVTTVLHYRADCDSGLSIAMPLLGPLTSVFHDEEGAKRDFKWVTYLHHSIHGAAATADVARSTSGF